MSTLSTRYNIMSSQPCLPVSGSNSNHRKRRKLSEKEFDTNNNTSKHISHPPLSFNDLQSLTADEYLSRVVGEARRLPEVSVATPRRPPTHTRQHSSALRPPPIDGCAAALSYLTSGHAALTPAPSDQYLPAHPRAWVDTVLDNFARLRGYLERCHDEGGLGRKVLDSESNGRGSCAAAYNRLPVPPLKDRAGWHVFCVGVDDAQGNEGSYFDPRENDALESPCGGEQERPLPPPAWRACLPEHGYQPEVSLLLQLDQVAVRKVLRHLSYYVEEGWSPAAHRRAAWLYALLARLEVPLHRDDAGAVRALLRRLLAVRSGRDWNPDAVDARASLGRLNALIAVTGVYFEQGGFQRVMTAVAADHIHNTADAANAQVPVVTAAAPEGA